MVPLIFTSEHRPRPCIVGVGLRGNSHGSRSIPHFGRRLLSGHRGGATLGENARGAQAHGRMQASSEVPESAGFLGGICLSSRWSFIAQARALVLSALLLRAFGFTGRKGSLDHWTTCCVMICCTPLQLPLAVVFAWRRAILGGPMHVERGANMLGVWPQTRGMHLFHVLDGRPRSTQASL